MTDAMREAASVDEFVRAPVGRYVLGKNSLVWCATARLCGTAMWGRAEEPEARRVTRAWNYEGQLDVPYDSVVDLQHLTGIDPDAFACVAEDLRARLPRLANAVRRQALVRPPGLPGAIVAGFYPTVAAGHEWSHFADDASAFAWLDVPVGGVAEEVRRLVDDARQAHPLLARVRSILRGTSSATPSLDETAASLGVSPRALQRALTDAGSSFRQETQGARVERACALLVDSDAKIEVVAEHVGCRSASAFVTFFRRAKGESPAAFRARHRG